MAEDEDLAIVVGRNLRLLRSRRGYSLERLAQISGVSRAMLGQIELGRSVPTINLLWKVARALGVPFASLTSGPQSHGSIVMKAADSKVLVSHSREFTSRALFPFDSQRKFEFYELRLVPKGIEKADARAAGTVENLVVSKGTVEIAVGAELHVLEIGDAILFDADVPHHYRNVGQIEALMFLVMTYVDLIG